jgi:hypothetical protein
MTKDDDNLRFWYEHELCRLRAAERAGFNVTKEKEEVTRKLNHLIKTTVSKSVIKPDPDDVTATVKSVDDVLPTDWTAP